MRFLWFDDVTKAEADVIKLRFTRVFFGSTPSQFLLNGVVGLHVDKLQTSDATLSKRLKRHIFVDDLNCGVKTSADGIEMYQKVKNF